ncbi:MAG: alpha/beta hydrolase [Bacteroidota bacterium]
MFYEYRGIRVYYEITGEGDSLVLLHGFLESSTMWKPLTFEFKHTHQVISIDLLGHGQTECLGYIHKMEDMANMVISLLNDLEVQEAKFIGHSMGGYVALAINHLKPELVAGLCLMNSTFEADSEEKKQIRQRSIEMAKINYDNLVRISFSNLFAPESRTSFKNAYNKALAIALKTPVQGYIAAQAGMQLRSNHEASFLKIKGPKALVIGKKDSLVDWKNLIKLLKNTPVKICHLSGGHMSHIEDLCELTYFLLRFI